MNPRLLLFLGLSGVMAVGLAVLVHGAGQINIVAGSASGTSNRNVDTDAPAPTTIQPPLPVRSGWPTESWLQLPPLPDVAYVVVQLTPLGWPSGAVAQELDDLGDVLAGVPGSSTPINPYIEITQEYLWQPGTQQAIPVPLQLAPYYSDVLDYLPATIVEPQQWRSLSSDGRVAGTFLATNHNNLAAVWSPATGTTTATTSSLSRVFPVLEGVAANVGGYMSAATVINSSGTVLGWEWLNAPGPPDSNGNPVWFTDLGGTSYATGSTTGTVLGAAASARMTFDPTTNLLSGGLFYLPVALNDAGTGVAIKTGPDTYPAHLIVLDAGAESDLGAVLVLATDGATTSTSYSLFALTNTATASVAGATVALAPPVALGSADAFDAQGDWQSSALWWTHPETTTTGGVATTTWSQSPLSVLDANNNQVWPWARQVRANDRLEMVLDAQYYDEPDSQWFSVPSIIRNEHILSLAGIVPANWTVNDTQDINNGGVILADAMRTVDANGNAISNPQSEPVLLVPLTAPLVDANRDGTIDVDGQTDATSQTSPFTFWLNDGVDGYSTIAGETTVQDALDPSANTPNNQQNRVTCTRDLENFARLWVNLAAMTPLLNNTTNPITVGLEWHSVTGSPAINLYMAAPAAGSTLVTGGTDYLTDSNSAAIQATGTYSTPSGVTASYGIPVGTGSISAVGTPFYFPADTFNGLTQSSPNAHFLFEGVSRGGGCLTLTFYTGTPGNYTKIGEGPGLWLDLKDIKEMYERWTVGDGPAASGNWNEGGGGAPNSSASISTDRLPGVSGANWTAASSNPVENNYILFVHGWNLIPWKKDAFAEEAFKRLYWQGYRGRFGTFQWPTTYHNGASVPADALASLYDFDQSEYTAWQSGDVLAGLLDNLNQEYPGKVYVFAHSHGNLVVGEALKQLAATGNQTVNTYVASQAAVAGQAYDGNLTGSLPLDFQLQSINTYLGTLGITVSLNLGPTTPNIFDNVLATGGGTPPVGTRVNFYNVNDYGMSQFIWQMNVMLRPDGPPIKNTQVTITLSGGMTAESPYGYAGDITQAATDAGFFKTEFVPDSGYFGGVRPVGTYPLHLSNTMELYEIRSFAAEPRSLPLGAVAGSIAGFASSTNLPSLWPTDTFQGGNYSDHVWHSAEFRFTNAEQKNYWNALMTKFGLPTNPNP